MWIIFKRNSLYIDSHTMRFAIMIGINSHTQNCLFSLILATLLSGCTSLPENLAANESMEMEFIDSKNARVESVQVRAIESGLKINGTLRKKYHGRGIIPGHLHIKVIGHNGEILSQTTSRYHRCNVKERRSSFSVILPVQKGEAARIEIIHHGLSDKHTTASHCSSQ